jgi:hypothetical protein
VQTPPVQEAELFGQSLAVVQPQFPEGRQTVPFEFPEQDVAEEHRPASAPEMHCPSKQVSLDGQSALVTH